MGTGIENRHAERHHVRFHLVYDDGTSFNAGTVRDVSEGGVFLETALIVPVGTVVALTSLDTAGQQLPFEVRAKVVRATPYDADRPDQPAGMGLTFLDLGTEEKKQVVALIRQLEQQAATFEGERDPFLGVRVRAPHPDLPTKV